MQLKPAYRPRIYLTSIPMSFEEHALAYAKNRLANLKMSISEVHHPHLSDWTRDDGDFNARVPIEAKAFCSDNSSLSDDSNEAHRPPLNRSKRYQCTRCPKSFDRPSTLKTHMNSHTGEQPHQCCICGTRFSVRSNMKRHMKCHSAKGF